MAQNISLLGADYSATPAILLPKTGGGMARFDDCSVTTATAADVASGKVFVAADGTITTGTNSGGGGGESNFVTGTFTTPATTGSTFSVTIPYAGSGYPIMAVVVIEGGAYNNTDGGNTDWYNAVQRYAVGQWTMTKSVMNQTPTFSTSGTQNQAVTTGTYKNSTSTATSYTRTGALNSNIFSSSAASANALTCCRFRSRVSLQCFVASTSYGLRASTEYRYWVVYSA